VSKPYEEILEGATLPRNAPDTRHEAICDRLHAITQAFVVETGNFDAAFVVTDFGEQVRKRHRRIFHRAAKDAGVQIPRRTVQSSIWLVLLTRRVW